MRKRRTQKKAPQIPIVCEVIRLGHDGRGIARKQGKTQFVDGALPGETVKAGYLSQRAKFDELKTIEILQASPERVSPPCQHADTCGGCSLQYMSTSAQIAYKQAVLAEQFKHFGNLSPEQWFEPLLGLTSGYRTKARLGVVYVASREEVIIGFREKQNKMITNIERCEVLDPRIGNKIAALRGLILSLSIRAGVPQIEVAMGDESVAVVVRHMNPLAEDDYGKLIRFAQAHGFELYLQPGDASTVCKIWPENTPDRLYYGLPFSVDRSMAEISVQQHDVKGIPLRLAFHPNDFTQVNAGINRQMVTQAIEWLDIQSTDRVLDLFCGLGNFTLPIACMVKEVVGVEGNKEMVQRGRENSTLNGLGNVSFFLADLQSDFTKEKWVKKGFDKILIDPPRSGALDIVNCISKFKATRIVYVSCNPATLARDAGILRDKGYTLLQAGVMDMFPHTAHVESIALFEKV